MKLMRNTTAVLVLTLFTGLAVFTAIQLGGRIFGTPTASAQTVTTQSATGQSGSSTGQSSSGSTQSDPNGYGSSSGSGSSSGGQTYTCPATGCTASTCHATQ
jgi:cytoskeletal protein RodZ